jgi:DNA-binding NarL/FixJ family response regulator
MVSEETRILIADDSPFIRTAYTRILETQDDFNVVSIAENGLQAVDQASELKPDVIVMDIRMPELDGISASHKIREINPDTSVVVVSAYEGWSYVFDLIRKDPEGKAYILKNSLDDIGELIRVVELVNLGHFVLDHVLSSRLNEYHERHPDEGVTHLEQPEFEVLSLLTEGFTYREIGSTLKMDDSEIEGFLVSAAEKLGVDSIEGARGQAQISGAFLQNNVSI